MGRDEPRLARPAPSRRRGPGLSMDGRPGAALRCRDVVCGGGVVLLCCVVLCGGWWCGNGVAVQPQAGRGSRDGAPGSMRLAGAALPPLDDAASPHNKPSRCSAVRPSIRRRRRRRRPAARLSLSFSRCRRLPCCWPSSSPPACPALLWL